jgi:carbamoyltransferase
VQKEKTINLVKKIIPNVPIIKVIHHDAHAYNAYLNSGFENATIITMDGQGESETLTVSRATKGGIEKLYASYWPNSLGIFYWFSTIHLGYEMGDEFKVMGMAAHGKPIYVDVLKTMICVDSNGCLEFHTNEYFGRKDIESIHGHYSFGFREKFYELIPERKPENEILQVHYDFAASLQKFTEDLGEEIARIAVKKTGFSQIALSGGLALNGLMNEKIRKSDFCSSIFIYPAAGDDGGAVGAAQYVVFEKSKIKPKRIHTSFYGEDYNNEEIESVILSLKLKYEKPVSIHKNIALAVSEGKIVARFYSKSEFGPRALGHRSILADPRKNEMKDILNERIKHREMFRPFAPACMKEFVTEFFDINGDADFMNLIVNAKPESKQRVPAVVHVDNTARVQTVGKSENIDFYKILNEFYLLTGIPIMINTSFNVNGEAIVETPLDAIESFGHMDIDFLAIGDYWIEKTANKTRFPVMTDSELIARRKERFKEKYKNLLKLYDLNNFEFSEPMNLLKNIENIKKLNIILEQKTSVRSSLLTKLIRFLKNK